MVDPAVTPHWRLEGVIATVDAVNGAHTLVAHEEAMKQAAVADRILLTKSDIASADQLTAAWRQLRSIAPGTPIIETIDGTVDPAAILAVGLYDAAGKIADVRRWLLREQQTDGRDIAHHHNHAGRGKAAGHPHDVSRHDDCIRAHCIIVEEPVSWTSFCYWLELLAAMRGEQMLRVKGIVAVSDHLEQPLVIHGVQHVFHPPVKLEKWPSATGDPRGVHHRDFGDGAGTYPAQVRESRACAYRKSNAGILVMQSTQDQVWKLKSDCKLINSIVSRTGSSCCGRRPP